MEDDEHYVDDPKNPQFQHHGGEYAYQGGNSGGDFEGEGFQGEHEGFEASGTMHQPCTYTTVCYIHAGPACKSPLYISSIMPAEHFLRCETVCQSSALVYDESCDNWSNLTRPQYKLHVASS